MQGERTVSALLTHSERTVSIRKVGIKVERFRDCSLLLKLRRQVKIDIDIKETHSDLLTN